jgi:hypothetical protein
MTDFVNRKQSLEDRDRRLELEQITLDQELGAIDSSEAYLLAEKIRAASADNLVTRNNFRQRFCKLYIQYEIIADGFEQKLDLAVKVFELIIHLYPSWREEPQATMAVSILTATIILKKGIDLYCAGVVA